MLAGTVWPVQGMAATKVHIVSFGKTTAVPWVAGTGDEKPITIKVRALVVDGRVKEYTLGMAHEVTERLFVVRRVFRVNDGLPGEPGPRWQWQRGGWLLVDRLTGRVAALNLPEFDPYPVRVSFESASDKQTFAIRGNVVDVVSDDDEDDK
jgi:hypothetical protein